MIRQLALGVFVPLVLLCAESIENQYMLGLRKTIHPQGFSHMDFDELWVMHIYIYQKIHTESERPSERERVCVQKKLVNFIVVGAVLFRFGLKLAIQLI